MVARSIAETAVAIIGSLGRGKRLIACKSGHSVGKVVTIEATIAIGESDEKLRSMQVVLGERNKGMNGIHDPAISPQLRAFRFGNKGSLMVQSCMSDKTSGDGGS